MKLARFGFLWVRAMRQLQPQVQTQNQQEYQTFPQPSWRLEMGRVWNNRHDDRTDV